MINLGDAEGQRLRWTVGICVYSSVFKSPLGSNNRLNNPILGVEPASDLRGHVGEFCCPPATEAFQNSPATPPA